MESTLRRLRAKFVAVTMAIVVAVIAVAFVTVGAITYSQDVSRVESALDAAIMRDASPSGAGSGLGDASEASGAVDVLDPAMPHDGSRLHSDESFERVDGRGGVFGQGLGADARGGLGKGDGFRHRFEIGQLGNDAFVPVAVFLLGADGNLESLSDDDAFSMSDTSLAEAAAAVSGAREGFGSLAYPPVFYMKRVMDGSVYVAFADESSASGWKSLAVMLGGVGIGAIAVFFLLALAFSKWALRPVEESWARQKQFVADASHELKTPLTVLAADVSILARHPEKTVASQSRWVESMEAEISDMQQLVGDMLELASAEAGTKGASASLSQIDLSKVVELQLLQFESLAYESGIDVESDVESGVEVTGDAEGVRRIVGTLLDNAYKYAGNGGRVNVRVFSDASGRTLSVSNSGAPIPPEDLPHVFDRFYRADKSRGRDERRSYGLGLAIAKETAESMGARLEVASTIEEGTVFRLRFA